MPVSDLPEMEMRTGERVSGRGGAVRAVDVGAEGGGREVGSRNPDRMLSSFATTMNNGYMDTKVPADAGALT